MKHLVRAQSRTIGANMATMGLQEARERGQMCINERGSQASALCPRPAKGRKHGAVVKDCCWERMGEGTSDFLGRNGKRRRLTRLTCC